MTKTLLSVLFEIGNHLEHFVFLAHSKYWVIEAFWSLQGSMNPSVAMCVTSVLMSVSSAWVLLLAAGLMVGQYTNGSDKDTRFAAFSAEDVCIVNKTVCCGFQFVTVWVIRWIVSASSVFDLVSGCWAVVSQMGVSCCSFVLICRFIAF